MHKKKKEIAWRLSSSVNCFTMSNLKVRKS